MGPGRISLALVAGAFCGLVVGASQEGASPPKEVTYSRDVAPILYKNCAVCHRPNDIAPMSLLTYKEVFPWARAIRGVVVERKMPPWNADPKVGDFINDARLSDAEVATIDTWVRTGAKEGDPKDLPPAPVFQERCRVPRLPAWASRVRRQTRRHVTPPARSAGRGASS